MYSLIIIGPVLMFLLTSLFGRQLGGFYTCFSIIVSSFFSIILSFDALTFIVNSKFSLVYYVDLFTLFNLNLLVVNWHFYFDFLTLSMYCLITLVSFFIQIFSIDYMAEDASFVRFMVYLCFFIIAILLLVGSANLLQLFFGWELVGLASFLLINFWYARLDANISAYKAVAVNRVGDCFLLLAIFIFFYLYGTIEFDLLFSIYVADSWTALAFFFITIGAFAKSAQFFFQGWLPDAMEGPTPVSALLHSATMVTAGVFLMLRFIDILVSFELVRYLITFFGLITALYAISIAAVSDDTKRATAYTTLNQLGFMFFGCASLAGATVLFHLIVHGFYKSFAFLSSAVELFDLEDEQDGEADSLDSNTSYNYYDILSSIVFVSINAIPFTSPSISKEFMLLSGAETGSDSLILLTTFVLFASPIDEGRDDKDDYETYHYYSDDLYVPSSLPYFITFSVTALGIISIFSAACLEEFFLDISFVWSPNNFFSWLDTKGSMLIFLPFLSIIFSDWDNSRSSLVEDFSFYPVLVREDNRYQSLMFNLELWFYDEKIASISKYFYSFANFFILQVQDRAFLENFFVNSFYYFDKIKNYFFVQLYSIEIYYPATLLFFFIAVLASFPTLPFFWLFILTLFVELYHFFENFNLAFYKFLDE